VETVMTVVMTVVMMGLHLVVKYVQLIQMALRVEYSVPVHPVLYVSN
jgi:hypothetical protein